MRIDLFASDTDCTNSTVLTNMTSTSYRYKEHLRHRRLSQAWLQIDAPHDLHYYDLKTTPQQNDRLAKVWRDWSDDLIDFVRCIWLSDLIDLIHLINLIHQFPLIIRLFRFLIDLIDHLIWFQICTNSEGTSVWALSDNGKVFVRFGILIDDLPVGESWIEVLSLIP